MDNVEQQILDALDYSYSHTTFSTRLYDLFCKQDDGVKKYIKVGRKFWHFDENRKYWRKLTVTYTRTGVMFFTFDDEPDVEHAWFISCMYGLTLQAAEIHPYEISEILREWYPDNNFAEICKQCKWDDCGGRITVDVVWD